MYRLKLVFFLFLMLFVWRCQDEPKVYSEPIPTKEGNNTDMLNDGWTENLVVLQGDWVNVRDENEIIIVKKNDVKWSKKGAPTKEAWIEAYTNCPNYCSSKNNDVTQFSCFVLKEGNSAECFTINKLTKGALIFTNITGKPQMHTFKKVAN